MNLRRFSPFLIVAAVTACAVPLPESAARLHAPTSSESTFADMEMQIVALVNAERRQRGLRELTWNPRLGQAAWVHAQNMARFKKMAHVLPESGLPTLAHRAEYVDYRYIVVSENIALGFEDAESVMRGWMNSPGHRRNLLSREIVEIGTAVASSSNGRFYFCQVFGRPLGSV